MVYPEECKEIRGVQFVNTAFRELFYSRKIGEIIKPYGYKVGNEGIGLWRYSPEETKFLNACPYIDKFCGLYKTYGDKRLATNLIGGLMMLLRGVKVGKTGLIKQLFDKRRLNEKGELIPTHST
jgi:hypothetical protein